ncbi:MAG TPA: cytochrome c3 family protein [Bdellovibrionales bacterium]|nr:cytochrome c3 family protein [Bdellovibrionales bacterium]
MKRALAIAVALFAALGFSETSPKNPYTLLPAKRVFELQVPGPARLAACAGTLWVFSVRRQALVAVNLSNRSSRDVELPPSLPRPLRVSALACHGDELLVLANAGPRGVLLARTARAENAAFRALSLPEPSPAHDLFCGYGACAVLQNKLHVSSDLKTFKTVEVPKDPDIEYFNSSREQNPFEGWQDRLDLSRTMYRSGAMLPLGGFVLIDPFRPRIVVFEKGIWKKWGRWGVWEGSFKAPKLLATAPNGSLFIADPQLRAVFAFERDGAYRGALSADGVSLFTPGFPQGLAAAGDRLFVSDFLRNRVQVFEVQALAEPVERVHGPTFRQNFMRRPELTGEPVQSCWMCHDSGALSQLHKLEPTAFKHPVSCGKCHDAHHTSKEIAYLQFRPGKLCQSCHEAESLAKTNHVWDGRAAGGACASCHAAHSLNAKGLVKPPAQLCVSCHAGQNHHHREVAIVAQVESARKIPLHEGKISCTTCHAVHHRPRDEKFMRAREDTVRFCASCHGERTNRLYSDFHKLMKKGTP